MSITRWPKSLVISAAALALGLTACTSQDEGPTQTQTRTLAGFEAIELRGAARLDVLANGPFTVTLVGSESVLAKTETRVENGRLIIENRRRGFVMFSMDGRPPQLRVSLPKLTALELNGAGNVTINGVAGDALSISLQGAGNLEATGKVQRLVVSLNGAGNLDMSRLVSQQADVTLNGAGQIKVHATAELSSTLNGVGSVAYFGNPPTVKNSLNGAGSIKRAVTVN
jgi:hypothetical protein